MRIFTIGYEGATQQELIAALRQAGVGRVIDVRAVPLSRKPGFSKNVLAAGLRKAGIDYVHLKALGTPPEGREAARKGKWEVMERVYAAQLETPEAGADAARMIALAQEKPSALLCFERDPAHCHRTPLRLAVMPDWEAVDLDPGRKADPEPRLFADDEAIRRVGESMLDCTLPRPEWTHEAHLATCAWLILERPDIVPERDLPGLIRRYNESVGGVNSDTEGYHETITQVFIRGVRGALARSEGRGLCDRVNALLLAEEGRRDWPLSFYSRELLFSKQARLGWVEPDLEPLGGCAADQGSGRA